MCTAYVYIDEQSCHMFRLARVRSTIEKQLHIFVAILNSDFPFSLDYLPAWPLSYTLVLFAIKAHFSIHTLHHVYHIRLYMLDSQFISHFYCVAFSMFFSVLCCENQWHSMCMLCLLCSFYKHNVSQCQRIQTTA